MSDILAEIVAVTRQRVAEGKEQIAPAAMKTRAAAAGPPRDFIRVVSGNSIGLIAEYKRRSPSRGIIREELEPAALAQAYARAGAGALSILTEPHYFDGSGAFVEAVREVVPLPVLRKDFLVEPYQIYESRALGADAVLLIVAALADEGLAELLALAGELGMAALVEVHTRDELERAVAAGAAVIGINNRDLHRFVTDLQVTEALASQVPGHVHLVSESGIRTRADVERLAAAGVDAVLVGTSLMEAADPGAAARQLTGVARHGAVARCSGRKPSARKEAH